MLTMIAVSFEFDVRGKIQLEFKTFSVVCFSIVKMGSKNASSEQIAIMVEFMERHGDIANMVNTPQGKVRRQELWHSLKMLLGQVGSGPGPDKSVEQWIKTWSDLKHRTKKKSLLNQNHRAKTGGGPCRLVSLSDLEKRISCIIGVRNVFGGPIQETIVELPVEELPVEEPPAKEPTVEEPSVQILISEQITDNDEQNDIHAASSSGVYAAPSSAIDAASDFGPSRDASQNRLRRVLRSTRRTSSNETPYERVAKEFAAAESRRLKLEEDCERRQHEIELRRLELDTLRETNLHAREAVRAQIDRDTINIQQEFLKLLKDAIDKFSDK